MWLIVATVLLVLGLAIFDYAYFAARRHRKQPYCVPIDGLLQRRVAWAAVRDRANHYSADDAGNQWELAVDTSAQGTRYIVSTDGHVVREVAYCPDGWVLEPSIA